ncbi:hypothetical protein [Sphingomonas bacterium]|uniref:hypothetical protein n=1 Tax=Sphingomonas bacterium TaxID=1895847 RepID=UPI00157670C6|nr:hypothetical protein [Sphingomonas bacterium]
MRHIFSAIAIASLLAGGPVIASVKPCRDASGKVVTCKKPRKESPRWKDAAGRFVACPPPADQPRHPPS